MPTKKIRHIFVPVFVWLTDLVLIIASFYESFFIRYGSDIPEARFAPFKESSLGLAFIYLLAFAFAGVFQKRFHSHWELFKKVFMGMVFGTLFSFVFLYVFRTKWASFPSSIFAIVVPVGTALIALVNILIYRLAKLLKTNLIIVGGRKGEELLVNRAKLEIYYVNNIEDILAYDEIDEVLICQHIQEDSQLNLLLYLLNKLKVNVSFSPGLYAELLSGAVTNQNSLRFLATFSGRKSEWEEFIIGLMDYIGSFILVVLLFPFMALIYLLVKITSKGPGLYTQKRVGKNGKEFEIYKFRTMVNNAEQLSGFVPASKQDSRITKIGYHLRKTRIDELPQLFNILKGQMSLVGPRPENVFRVNSHKALQGLRLAVKPGLTGLAQIRSVYDLHPNYKIKYDYLYIQRRSLKLNFYILFKTIPVVLLRKGL